MTIEEFLKARLAEDEAVARRVELADWRDSDGWSELHSFVADHAQRHDPARVLREVQAKRRLIGLHATAHECVNPPGAFLPDLYGEDNPCPTLRALAEIYADHPDYDPAWRP